MLSLVSVFQAIAPLAVFVLLGAALARAGAVPDVPRAITGLNVFALYAAFPALVLDGILDAHFELPTQWGFWLVVPLSQLALLAAVRMLALALRRREEAGTMALVGLFGNVAYLGLPFVIGVLGEDFRGAASLAVALYVVLAVGLGPILLTRWSAGDRATTAARTVLTQPLFWAPLVGLPMRKLPHPVKDALSAVTGPLGAAAAPVALFLLGLYLYVERDRLRGFTLSTVAHAALRLLIAPLVTWIVMYPLTLGHMLAHRHIALFLVLSGMPAAITTFSIAHDAAVGTDRVAATIVQSTLASVVTLPLLAALAVAL